MRPFAVALSLGTNIPPGIVRLRRALTAIGRHLRLVRVSSVWVTSPVGEGSGDRSFYNLAVSAVSDLPLDELMRVIQDIEFAHGRRTSRRNAPRPIDIDIIWADSRPRPGDPQLPHPRFRQRNFVLAPLSEIRFDRFDALTHRWISAQRGSGDLRRLGPLSQRTS